MKPKPRQFDPLHGVTLEQIVTFLEEHYGWGGLGERININCFNDNPSVKSSLKFLRKTPWARTKVESLYSEIKRREKVKEDKKRAKQQREAQTSNPDNLPTPGDF